MNKTKSSEDYFIFQSNYPSILVLCRCFDVWSQHSGYCSLQLHEREIQRERERVYAKLVCLVWSAGLISHAGCRTWSAKHQTECHRWSRFFLENQTRCLKQKCRCLICVWCKIETVLVASFVCWRQVHTKSHLQQRATKDVERELYTWQFMGW